MDEYTGSSVEYHVTTRQKDPRREDDGAAGSSPPDSAEPSSVGQCAEPGSNVASAEQLVYALGQIGYDFPSQSRRDSIKQRMDEAAEPEEPNALLSHLEANPHDAEAVQWTLNLQSVPIYILDPGGAYAAQAYELLRQFLREQQEEGVERVSVPGVISGVGRHRSGADIPILTPALRGMYSWTTEALVSAVAESQAGGEGAAAEDADRSQEVRAGVTNFLERVYYEIRNMGLEPYERALNFAATNAFAVEAVYEHAVQQNMELDTIDVDPSPLCPPGSDCWDVKLTFFFPERPTNTARRVYRFTVDVADIVPATIGPMRSWSIR